MSVEGGVATCSGGVISWRMKGSRRVQGSTRRKRTREFPLGGGALERLGGRRWPSARRPQRESTAAPPQKPTPQRHIARLFSLLPYKQGLEAVHIPGTLTTLLALLQCHEKYNKGGIEKLTGLQLPTEREWNMYTAVEVRDVARYCGGGGFVLQRGLLLFTSTTGCFPREASVGLPFTVQYSVDRFAAEFCHGRVLNPLLPITHTNPKHIPPISGAESPQP